MYYLTRLEKHTIHFFICPHRECLRRHFENCVKTNLHFKSLYIEMSTVLQDGSPGDGQTRSHIIWVRQSGPSRREWRKINIPDFVTYTSQLPFLYFICIPILPCLQFNISQVYNVYFPCSTTRILYIDISQLLRFLPCRFSSSNRNPYRVVLLL